MPHLRIWIHAVWGTKEHRPYLQPDLKKQVIEHIFENARARKLHLIRVNGHVDHLHCLLSLNADLSIAKTMQLVKGESAFWANKVRIIAPKFEWAEEYFASSVSESMIDRVISYIDNQEEHHRKVTFKDEYAKFLTAHKLT